MLKVLSDEEAEAFAEEVEAEMATMEDIKRIEARQSCEQVERIQRMTSTPDRAASLTIAALG